MNKTNMANKTNKTNRTKIPWVSLRRGAQLLSIPLLIWLAGIIGWLWIAVGAVVLSLVLGRFFCGWMCPIGTVEEYLGRLMVPKNPKASYRIVRPSCRFGCPVAWVSGKLNKISLFRIGKANDKCTKCGECDKVCPTGLLEFGASYKSFKTNPSHQYACIRCLSCVGSCPQGALSLKLGR
ncbi:MAG: 4Fe-4S binding protein [Desulfitobacteriaceae bacterium]